LFCPYCGSELKENHMFCPSCGKKVERPAKEVPSVLEPAPVVVTKPLEVAAPREPREKFSKKTLVLAALAVAIVAFTLFAFTVKCIPIVRSYTVDEKYQQTEWIPTKEIVFQDTVYLDRMNTYGSGWRKDSRRFWLEKHWEILIEAQYSNTYGWASLYDSSDRSIGSNKGTYVTPNSGQYYVTFSNFGSSTGCTVSVKITVTAKLQVVEKTITITKYEVAHVTVVEWLTRKT